MVKNLNQKLELEDSESEGPIAVTPTGRICRSSEEIDAAWDQGDFDHFSQYEKAIDDIHRKYD